MLMVKHLFSIYLALAPTLRDSCFSIYQNNGIKMQFVFKERIQCKPFFCIFSTRASCLIGNYYFIMIIIIIFVVVFVVVAVLIVIYTCRFLFFPRLWTCHENINIGKLPNPLYQSKKTCSNLFFSANLRLKLRSLTTNICLADRHSSRFRPTSLYTSW